MKFEPFPFLLVQNAGVKGTRRRRPDDDAAVMMAVVVVAAVATMRTTTTAMWTGNTIKYVFFNFGRAIVIFFPNFSPLPRPSFIQSKHIDQMRRELRHSIDKINAKWHIVLMTEKHQRRDDRQVPTTHLCFTFFVRGKQTESHHVSVS